MVLHGRCLGATASSLLLKERVRQWRQDAGDPRLGLALSVLISLVPQSVLAQSVGSNLDLSSATANISSSNKSAVNIQSGGSLNNGTVSGGNALTVSPGQLVTPAQYLAVFGAIQGKQTLLLNSSGAATGGSANLSSTQVQNLASLTVPTGVSVNAIGYNAATPLNVSGNVNILGSVYSLQNAANIMSVLNMGSLNIASGGLLTGHLPSGGNLAGLFASAGMQLNVAGNVLNQGIISTPGVLNVIAGGSITNQSANNVQAQISAQNVNLLTGTGSIINSGLIQALDSVSLNTTVPTTNLLIDNTSGIIQALTGAINIRQDDANLELASAGVFGGRLDAAVGTNVFGKDMFVFVDSASGAISNKGSTAHVSVNSGNLLLGRQILSGDPTYYNNAGDITISDLTSVAGDLAIVASGQILTTGNTTIQTQADDLSITMMAGYNFTVTPSNASITSFSANAAGDTANTLTFDGTTNGSKNINPDGFKLNLSTTGAASKITLMATGGIDFGSGIISTDGQFVASAQNMENSGGVGSISTTSLPMVFNIATQEISSGSTILDGKANITPNGLTPGLAFAITLPSLATKGGSITITAPTASVLNTGSISTVPDTTGDGGAINVTTVAAVRVKGPIDARGIGGLSSGAFVDLNAVSVRVDGGIDASTSGKGSSGAVNISSNVPITVNKTVLPDAGTIAGTITSSGQVTLLSASDVILDGAGTAVTANSIGIDATQISSAGSGMGILNSPIVALKASGSIGTSTVPINISSSGAIALAAKSSGTDLNLNITTAGTVTSQSLTVGTVTANGIVINGAGSTGQLIINGGTLDVTSAVGAIDKMTVSAVNIIGAGTIAATNVELTADFIANAPGGFNTAASSLKINSGAAGSIDIINTSGSLNFESSDTAFLRVFQFGNLTLSNNISSKNLSLTVNPGSAIDLNGFAAVAKTANLNLQTDNLIFSGGNLSATKGDVVIVPATPGSNIFLGASAAGLSISAADLANNVSGNGLTIGNAATTSDIIINAPIAPGAKNFNLITQKDVLAGIGNSISILPSGSLNVSSNVTALYSVISGGNATIQVTSQAAIQIDSNVGSATDTVSLTNKGGFIIGNGTITAKTFSVVSQTSGTIDLKTAVTQQLDASILAGIGDVNINNTGDLGSASLSTTDGKVTLNNSGNLTLTNISGPSGVSITLGTGKTLTISGTVKSKDSPISVVADGLNTLTSNIFDAGTSTVTLAPATSGLDIGLGGSGPPGLNIDSTIFSGTKAKTLLIGTDSASNISMIGSVSSFGYDLSLKGADIKGPNSALLQADNLVLDGKNIDLFIQTNSVSATASGNVNLHGAFSKLAVPAVGTGGTITVNAGASFLTLSGPVNGDGAVFIQSSGYDNGGFTVSSKNSAITVFADTVTLVGKSFDAGTGTVGLAPLNTSASITIGNTGINFLVTPGQLQNITAGDLVLGGLNHTGGITFTNDLDVSAQGYNLFFLQGASAGFDTNGSALTGGGNILVDLASGPISVNKVSSKASDGAVTLQTKNSVITLNALEPDAHIVNIKSNGATGTITGLSPLGFSPRKDGNNGGSVYLAGSNLPFTNYVLDVSANAGGDGGTVVYENTKNDPATFNPTSSNLKLNITGDNQGSATIITSGNFTYNSAGNIIQFANTGKGPGIGLVAGRGGTGNLLVMGDISSNGNGGKDAGSILLESSSPTAFNIGLKAKSNINGIQGALIVNGSAPGFDGDITVINRGGGIVSSIQPLINVNNLTFDTVGAANGIITIGKPIGNVNTLSVNLMAGGKGTILPGANLITANTLNMSSSTGMITAKTASPNLTVNTGGTANVTITNAVDFSDLALGTSSAGGKFVLTHAGGELFTVGSITAGTGISLKTMDTLTGINLDGDLIVTNTATGAITLTANGGNIAQSNPGGSDSIQAKTLTLTTATGTIGNSKAQADALRIKASSFSTNTTGLISLDNLGFGSPLTIKAAKTAGTTFTVFSKDSVVVTASMPNVTEFMVDASASTNGSVTVNGSQGNSSSTKVISLIAGGTGSVLGSGTLTTNNLGSVDLETVDGSIGSTTPIKTNTPALLISSAAGSINVSDSRTTGPIAVSALNAGGALTFKSAAATNFSGLIKGSSVKVTTVGNTTIGGDITATTGAVSFVSTKGTTTVGKNVSAGSSAKIQVAGGLDLLDITAKSGSISVTTTGTTKLGNVDNTGSFPVTIKQTGGAALTIAGANAGTAFTATNTGTGGIVTQGDIDAVSSITLTASGKDAGITLGGNVKASDNSVGTAKLSANGKGNIQNSGPGSDSIRAKTLTLTSGTGTFGNNVDALRIEASSLAANTTGNVNLNNLGFDGGSGKGSLTLTAAKPKGEFFVDSPFGLTVKASLAGATDIALSTDGVGITVTGALGNAATTSKVTLTTNLDVTGTGLITGAVVGINSKGSVGSSTAALKVKTPDLSVNGNTTLINLSNSNTTATDVSDLMSTGPVTMLNAGATSFGDNNTGTSVTLKSVGASSVGNVVASTGAITFTQTGTGAVGFNGNMSAGTSITVTTAGSTTFTPAHTITANDGAITVTESTGLLTVGKGVQFLSISPALSSNVAKITLLEKANTTGSGITIGDGASLITDFNAVKPGTTFPRAGQISIVVGASVPSSPAAGTPVTSNIIVTGGASNIFWGAVPITSNAGTGGTPENTLNVIGPSAIVFQAGSKAPVTLGGSTTITADPPVVTASTGITQAVSSISVSKGSVASYGRSAGGSPASNSVSIPSQSSELIASPTTNFTSSTILNSTIPIKPTSESKDLFSPSSGILHGSINESSDLASVIFNPKSDTRISTKFGTIEIDAGSLALVFESEHAVSIFNLDDLHRNAVRVQSGSEQYSLSPGKQITIARREINSFDNANPVESIAYRCVTESECGANRVFHSEFSIPSAISSVKSLRTLLSSKDRSFSKQKVHLLKTLAAMLHMKTGGERYQQILRPRTTAFNQ